jgi:cation diffusion facilitator CzcD-associated flavoprotein CzcO
MDTCDVAVLGAGPYGLSMAAHLRQSTSIDLRLIGEPMSFWERHMPQGMLLRSPRVASDLADPHRRFTLEAYEKSTGGPFVVKMPPTVTDEFTVRDMAKKIPLADFIKYGHWFLRRANLPLDTRLVSRVEIASEGFELIFDGGESLRTKKVVVAGGIAPFARIPKPFADLPSCLASHTSQHTDLGKFRGKDVLVIGAGQSALESAVLLDEAGAHVQVMIRQPLMRWLGINRRWMHTKFFSWMFYGPADVGPAGVSLLVQRPNLYRRLPRTLQDRWAPRSIRPAASCWVKARCVNVKIHTGRFVVQARPEGERVRVQSNDGMERLFDHVLLGTGYRVDIARYPFLSPEVLEKIKRVDGFPVLDNGFETSLSGMHFVGAPSTWSFGPLMRFVAGAEFAAPAVAHRILRAKQPQLGATWLTRIKERYAALQEHSTESAEEPAIDK